VSILTAQCMLGRMGIGSDLILTLKVEIDGLCADMWSLVVVALQSKEDNNNETRKLIEKQIDERIENFKLNIKQIDGTLREKHAH